MRRLWLVGLGLGLACIAGAQFTDQERQGLADALFLSNLDLNDLSRPRCEKGPEWIQRGINDPVSGLGQWTDLQTIAGQRNLAQLVGHVRTKIYGDAVSFATDPVPPFEIPQEVPESLRPSIKRLAEAIHRSNEWVRQGLQKLSAAERRTLIEALPRMAVGSAPVKFEFVRQPLPSESEVQQLLAKADLAWIRFAAQMLTQDVQEELPKLREAAKTVTLAAPLKLTIQGVVVEIGGTGNDTHADNDAVLCIDLGGNDRYTGRYGAGVGYSAVLVDLGGDDVYECPDLSIGAGVLGVGLAFDLGGDDRFRGRSICFGSGIGGVGALLKDGGEDDYRSTSLAQGFGYLGMGLLIDTKGEDHYRVGLLGQGAGRNMGMGWLIDKAGDDTYRSGGLASNPYLENFTISMAQGAADGPGALGCLFDLGGNDDYLGDTRSQAYATKDGGAALMDSDGRDSYMAGHDSQSCALQRGGAYLVDTAGDDIYTLRLGNGHSFGSNYGLAILIDRAGDDLYAGHDSRPGIAAANGAAIFLDDDGDDRYQGMPGVGSPARGSGSIAVFVDLGGNDTYPEGFANGQARSESNWGNSLDVRGQSKRPDLPESPKPGSKPLPDDATMEATFRLAREDDRKAIDDLIGIGEPALRWLLAKKLDRADAETIALIGWLAIQTEGSAEEICVAAIDLTKEASADAAIQICQIAGFRRAGPKIVEALERPGLMKMAIRSAGALGVEAAIPKLTAIAQDKDPDLKRSAMSALGQIGNEGSFALMESALEDLEPETRFAAVSLIAKYPGRALPVGKRLIGSPTEKSSRTGIELLAAIGNAEALNEIGKALSDPRRGVKVQALMALDGRFPKEFRPVLLELRKSPDALVAAVAGRVDSGR